MTKRPTIADVARQAGVSTAVVSYALNGKPGVSEATRQRVLKIADEVGWRPSVAATSLSRSRASAAGLVLAREAGPAGVEHFFMDFMSGLQQILSGRGIALLLQIVDNHSAAVATYRQWWAERRVDAVIVTDVWSNDVRLDVLAGLDIPTVALGDPAATKGLPSVWTDDAAAFGAAADYLLSLGHRRLARVSDAPQLDNTVVRTNACLASLQRTGGSLEVTATDLSPAEGAAATRRLLQLREPPSAIIYDNDLMAVAGMDVARRMGVEVPWDLSIVAGDNSSLCRLATPSLTALTRDVTGYGATTARALLSLLDGDDPGAQQTPTAELTVRGSTAPPAR